MLYSIIGRHMNGANVIGYVLRDENTGEMSLKDRDTTYKIALDKNMVNAKAQVYKGTVVMRGTFGKLSNLPLYDADMRPIIDKADVEVRTTTITGKVLQGKAIVKYRVTEAVNGIPVRSGFIDKDQVANLARKGLIDNIRVQRCNGEDILRSTDNFKLSEVPVVGHIR